MEELFEVGYTRRHKHNPERIDLKNGRIKTCAYEGGDKWFYENKRIVTSHRPYLKMSLDFIKQGRPLPQDLTDRLLTIYYSLN